MLTLHVATHDPYVNLALEEYIFSSRTEDDIFYLWRNSPAVVVGSFQNILREVSMPMLHRMNIPVLRRISGGGTVYHDLGNVNYTYITSHSAVTDYDDFLSPVIQGLNALGIPAQKNRNSDIAINGRKISGSAQRSSNGRVLHHGTLLFASDLAALDRIAVQNKNFDMHTKGTPSAICTVTNICEYTNAFPTIQDFERALLTQMLPSGTQTIQLDRTEQSDVIRLAREKYQSWEWTWGRTPAFVFQKEGIFGGAPIRVRYTAKHGYLSDVQVDCVALPDLSERLEGHKLDPDTMYTLCRTVSSPHAFELLSCLL